MQAYNRASHNSRLNPGSPDRQTGAARRRLGLFRCRHEWSKVRFTDGYSIQGVGDFAASVLHTRGLQKSGAVSNLIQTRARDRPTLGHRNHATRRANERSEPNPRSSVMQKGGGVTYETAVEVERALSIDRRWLC